MNVPRLSGVLLLTGLFAAISACTGTPAPLDAQTDAVDALTDVMTVCRTDLECTDRVFCNGAERCMPGAPGADSNGCLPAMPATPCTAGQMCDEATLRCVVACPGGLDLDGDGHRSTACGGDDCDDADPNRFPGHPEVCDAAGHDEDCDTTTFGFRDSDGDGFGDAVCCNTASGGARTCGNDCNDGQSNVHPGLAESCDTLDNDCNGTVDDGVMRTFHVDADHDGYGAMTGAPVTACNPPAGYVESMSDCDDTLAAVHPGAVETCDTASLDENCDGTANPPSLCSCAGDVSRACALPGTCGSGTQRCVTGSWGACSIGPVAESCNGIDDDCDGSVDEMLNVMCYPDADNDGFAPRASVAAARCPVAGREGVGGCPTFETSRAPVGIEIDCDDASTTAGPGRAEICNGRDDDCDGMVDEGVTLAFHRDADGDGYGDANAVVVYGCTAPANYVSNASDCDDANASRHPGLLEICDGIDNDCDGALDGPGEDDDRDGHADATCAGSGGDDCDDGNALIYRGAPELCDRRDNDCSAGGGAAPAEDQDNDGYAPFNAACTGGTLPRVDCDDQHATAFPGASELCDGVDNDCDGMTDEAPDATASCSSLRSGVANTQWTCSSGACGVATCAGTFANCNASALDGCESDLQTSETNCGTCGNACRAGIECIAGACDEVAQVSVGGYFVCARRTSGRVQCWGWGTNGELGNGVAAHSRTPVNVSGLTDAVAVATGGSHACAIRRDGTAWCWGDNAYGQLGNGTTTASLVPVRVSALTGVVTIAAGDSGTCAIRNDGSTWCWGSNTRGEIGDGTTIQRTVPTRVLGLAPAEQVAVAFHSTCAVLASSDVYCWGANDWGQLGNESTVDSLSPVHVRDLQGLSTEDLYAWNLTAGETHFCAVDLFGGVLCWGNPFDQRLGRSRPSSNTLAHYVTGLMSGGNGRMPAAGSSHSCVLRTSQSVSCWGDQSYGQIGNGAYGWNAGSTATPQTVPIIADAIGISAFSSDTCVLRENRDVFCWGSNDVGQLGDGTTTDRALPTMVRGLR